MSLSNFGQNLQTIRKYHGLTQQELADKIGINLQNLSKIERGIHYPAFQTLEKIFQTLKITPNELFSEEFKVRGKMEGEIIKFLEREEELIVHLEYGEMNRPLSIEEWRRFELDELRKYIKNYIDSPKRHPQDLYPIRKAIFDVKFAKVLKHYDDYYCYDIYTETLQGNKYPNPYIISKGEEYIMNDESEVIERIPNNPDDFED